MATNIMHSAQAKSIGGRDGRIESTDNVLNLELTMPRALGGRAREGATNPEQLFAAGYAACFGNAVIHTARQAKVSVGNISVDARVELFMNEDNLPTLGVALHVNLPDVVQAQAQEIVAQAHQTCPYSRATRGNIDVNLIVTTDAVVAA
ncbi:MULTISPECIES: organic hydroperoxide resistance protein [Spirosoma]|uniref:Organic hydroperoxide resistance protein n=1 Tax=Spirosoma liriopis TaxID=2937440 RepID=A0ABT0HV79_9BACT|nr:MULTISPECIES: organic hydroperoxide resistance protein [Spirosoma]MCK8495518.1 organic hydroperoxide resistance protein [Spirosoma liriopis]UHG94530.1 organic hydroperoxide resistance protein [Spirosoma oryzicola]